MTRPRISIITPSYNQGRYIERTICSVLDQKVPGLQYIVIDGQSTDDSVELIRHYESELNYWSSRPTLGQAHAINAGLVQAAGDIVAVLPAGDVYQPQALDTVMDMMSGEQSPQWVVGSCASIGEYDEWVGTVDASAPASLASFLMHNSGNLPVASSFYHRQCIERAGTFAGDLRFAFGYEYCCRLLSCGDTVTVTGHVLVGKRECSISNGAQRTLQQGMEYLDAASRYATALPLKQRYALWANLDRRRRIYALAEAETASDHAKRLILNELIRRPWWLRDDAVRHVLMHGIEHPVPAEMLRPAA